MVELGFCLPLRAHCERMLARLRSVPREPAYQLGNCSPQSYAICFDARTIPESTKLRCFPTFAICRADADSLEALSGEAPECQSTPDGVAPSDPDSSAHWWCYGSEIQHTGSCERSRRACEHRRLRDNLRPDDLTECAPQQTASCFDFKDVTGRGGRLCQPSLAICEGVAKVARTSPQQSFIGDCRPVD